MGAAIDVFDGASAIAVPRSRFAPVKTTNDLLDAALRRLRPDRRRAAWSWRRQRDGRPPFVDLDPAYYKLVADFEQRFAAGPPSLIECERLVVEGDVTFGAGVRGPGLGRRCEGPARIEDGDVLEG